jgi:hypothetical protein
VSCTNQFDATLLSGSVDKFHVRVCGQPLAPSRVPRQKHETHFSSMEEYGHSPRAFVGGEERISIASGRYLAVSARKPALLFAVPSPPAGIAWVAGFDAGDAGPLAPCRAGRRKISSAAIRYISMHARWKRYSYSWPTLVFCAASQDSEPRMSVDGLMSTHERRLTFQIADLEATSRPWFIEWASSGST